MSCCLIVAQHNIYGGLYKHLQDLKIFAYKVETFVASFKECFELILCDLSAQELDTNISVECLWIDLRIQVNMSHMKQCSRYTFRFCTYSKVESIVWIIAIEHSFNISTCTLCSHVFKEMRIVDIFSRFACFPVKAVVALRTKHFIASAYLMNKSAACGAWLRVFVQKFCRGNVFWLTFVRIFFTSFPNEFMAFGTTIVFAHRASPLCCVESWATF